MPFVALPTTAGDGVGAAQDVTTLNPSKVFTLSATQAPAGGLLLIEGSNDAAEIDFVPVPAACHERGLDAATSLDFFWLVVRKSIAILNLAQACSSLQVEQQGLTE